MDKLVRRIEEEHVTDLIVALNTDVPDSSRSTLTVSVSSCPLIDVVNPNLKERIIVNFCYICDHFAIPTHA